MIFAMMGLREYGQVFHDTVSVGLWNAGVATLVTNLYRFEHGLLVILRLCWFSREYPLSRATYLFVEYHVPDYRHQDLR